MTTTKPTMATTMTNRITTFEARGAEVIIRPSSGRAREWLASFCADRRWTCLANAAAECALYGGTIACAPSIATVIADEMAKAGFRVNCAREVRS